MSKADKELFRNLLDVIKLYHRQREALFQILNEKVENWEPVFRILQDDNEIVHRADTVFAPYYASIDAGERDSEALEQFLKDPLTKWKPN